MVAVLLFIQGIAGLVDGVLGLHEGITWLVIPFGIVDIVSGWLIMRGKRVGGLLAFAITLLNILSNLVSLMYPTVLFGFPAIANLIVCSLVLILLVKAWAFLQETY